MCDKEANLGKRIELFSNAVGTMLNHLQSVKISYECKGINECIESTQNQV